MATELVKSGIPIGTTSLREWNTSSVNVQTSGTGYYFNIRSGGFMAQFSKVIGQLNNAQILFDYANTSGGLFAGNLIFTDDSGESTKCALKLPSANTRRKLTWNVPVGVQSNHLAIEFRNSNPMAIQLYGISILGDLDTSSQEVNTQDFVKCAILYGTDANKPKLR